VKILCLLGGQDLKSCSSQFFPTTGSKIPHKNGGRPPAKNIPAGFVFTSCPENFDSVREGFYLEDEGVIHGVCQMAISGIVWDLKGSQRILLSVDWTALVSLEMMQKGFLAFINMGAVSLFKL